MMNVYLNVKQNQTLNIRYLHTAYAYFTLNYINTCLISL